MIISNSESYFPYFIHRQFIKWYNTEHINNMIEHLIVKKLIGRWDILYLDCMSTLPTLKLDFNTKCENKFSFFFHMSNLCCTWWWKVNSKFPKNGQFGVEINLYLFVSLSSSNVDNSSYLSSLWNFNWSEWTSRNQPTKACSV